MWERREVFPLALQAQGRPQKWQDWRLRCRLQAHVARKNWCNRVVVRLVDQGVPDLLLLAAAGDAARPLEITQAHVSELPLVEEEEPTSIRRPPSPASHAKRLSRCHPRAPRLAAPCRSARPLLTTCAGSQNDRAKHTAVGEAETPHTGTIPGGRNLDHGPVLRMAPKSGSWIVTHGFSGVPHSKHRRCLGSHVPTQRSATHSCTQVDCSPAPRAAGPLTPSFCFFVLHGDEYIKAVTHLERSPTPQTQLLTPRALVDRQLLSRRCRRKCFDTSTRGSPTCVGRGPNEPAGASFAAHFSAYWPRTLHKIMLPMRNKK